MSGARGSSRVQAKLEAALAAGDFYEAHQMYRTLSYRLSVGRNWAALLELLFSGAVRFLDQGQVASGGDLAQLYAEKLAESLTPVGDDVLLRLETLISRIPAAASDQTPEDAQVAGVVDRARLIDTTLAWSKAVSTDAVGRRKGHPGVHAKLALVYWSEKDFVHARRHFLLSDDGERCASFLVEYQMAAGYACEVDMFVAQAVLQFLANQKPPVATIVFEKYVLEHPKISTASGPPYTSPLLNFLWLLLLSVEMKRLQEFTILVEQYKPSLDRDPAYIDYVHKIAELYFGVPPPQPKAKAGSNFLSNLFSSFLAVDEDESGDEEGPTAAAAAAPAAQPKLQDTAELD